MKNISLKHTAKGFSLVDVMVGMVISLLGVIIIFQVFNESEKIKRRTTGGGEAQQNGVAGLFYLERAIKEAGYGFNTADVAAGTLPLTPTINAANTPDNIAVISRRNWAYGSFLPVSGTSAISAPPALTTENFFITGSQLATDDGIPGGTAVVIADGIVQMKTNAILDGNGNIVALRLALVARSAQPEKSNGVCATTTGPAIWSQGTLDLSGNIGLAAGDDWKCYRYKTFETTVPLRNVIWR